MKTNEITIETIRNTNTTTKNLINVARTMTPEQLDLLIEIMGLTAGRPDRQQLALSWPGKMNDLPAVLAQI